MPSACFAVGQDVETRGKPGVVVAIRQPYYDVKMTETQQIKTNQHYVFLQAKIAQRHMVGSHDGSKINAKCEKCQMTP